MLLFYLISIIHASYTNFEGCNASTTRWSISFGSQTCFTKCECKNECMLDARWPYECVNNTKVHPAVGIFHYAKDVYPCNSNNCGLYGQCYHNTNTTDKLIKGSPCVNDLSALTDPNDVIRTNTIVIITCPLNSYSERINLPNCLVRGNDVPCLIGSEYYSISVPIGIYKSHWKDVIMCNYSPVNNCKIYTATLCV